MVPPSATAFARWALRHGRLLWVIATLLAIPALGRTIWLYAHLRSDLDELLPRDAPSVLAIEELRRRMTGLQYLGVVVDTGDASKLPAAERFIDALATRVRAYPPDLVGRVRIGVAEERAFAKAHAPLYMDLADLKTIYERVDARKEWEAARAFGASLDDDPAPPLEFADLENKYRARDTTDGKFPNDRFSSPDLHLTLMLIEVGSYSLGEGTALRLLDRVRDDIAAIGPNNFAPGLKVGFTGDVAISVEELSALVTDLTVSSILVLALVVAVILGFYRWWRALPALVVPLLYATFYSFALVTLPPFNITELNSNTAFLGSIIVGNGINFGIILLARYLEERRAGGDVEGALAAGLWGARVGTLSASLAAAIAYGSLIVTRFRGFRQFGVIGGVGMILCWVCAFVLTPSLLRALDKGGPIASPVRVFSPMPAIARLASRHALAVVVVFAALTITAIVRVRHVDRSVIEHDFGKLRRADTFVRGEGFWGKKMDALLGQYLTPVVVLSDTPQQASEVERQTRAALSGPPLTDLVSSVSSHDDVMPPQQAEKIAQVKAIRKLLTPKIRSLLPKERLADLDRVLGSEELRPITLAELPRSFTSGMRENDGSIDRATLIFPRPSSLMWRGDAIIDFTTRLRAIAASATAKANGPNAPSARVAGSIPLSGDIIGSIERDAPIATGCALGGVLILVFAIFRGSSGTLLVAGSLLIAALWMFAIATSFGVKINFADFIAFPITFGIGVDYAVNIVARYDEERARGHDDIAGAVRATGGAVMLCSATTVIGYSSLLLAENRALFSFGVLAVLGEICCITTALIGLPAVVVLMQRRRAKAAPQAT